MTTTGSDKAVIEAMSRFKISGTTPLNSTGIDAVHEILPMIYGIATLLEMGHRTYEGDQAAFHDVNPELIASAFDGIAQLAALATFHAYQA